MQHILCRKINKKHSSNMFCNICSKMTSWGRPRTLICRLLSKICPEMEKFNFLPSGSTLKLYFKNAAVMTFRECAENDVLLTSLERHNVDFTSECFLHVLVTSLKKFYANEEVIFYASHSMFSYISIIFTFSQY